MRQKAFWLFGLLESVSCAIRAPRPSQWSSSVLPTICTNLTNNDVCWGKCINIIKRGTKETLTGWISLNSRCVLHFQDIPSSLLCIILVGQSVKVTKLYNQFNVRLWPSWRVGAPCLLCALTQHWYFKHYFKMCLFRSYFLTDDYCRWEDSCQFIIYSNFNDATAGGESDCRCDVCCVVYSLL